MNLLPRYSLKWMLGLMGLSALFFLAVSMAVNGNHLSAAAVIGTVAVLVVVAVQVFFFGVIWIFAQVMGWISSQFKKTPPPAITPPATSGAA